MEPLRYLDFFDSLLINQCERKGVENTNPPGETHSITAQEIFHGVLINDIPKQVVDHAEQIQGFGG